MVSDINTTGAPSTPSRLANADGTIFFQAIHPDYGAELWKSDGSASGTTLVEDLAAGGVSSYPESITAVGNRVFFTTGNAARPDALWVSDGSDTGTVKLREFPGVGEQYAWPFKMAAFDGQLYFLVNEQLTPAGSGATMSLWRSDGTVEGTELVKTLGQSYFPTELSVLDGRLSWTTYAYAWPNMSAQIWESDGTASNTKNVNSFALPASNAGTLNARNDSFVAFYDGAYFYAEGDTLYKATRPGTIAPLVETVVSVIPGGENESPTELHQLTASVNGVYFAQGSRGSSARSTLWHSDGSSEGTIALRSFAFDDELNIDASIRELATVADRVFFYVDDELWVTDGTLAGTSLVEDLRPGSSSAAIGSLVGVGNRLYFRADDGVHGAELWSSDGTTDGTAIVRDIYAGLRSSFPGANVAIQGRGPTRVLAVGDQLYFSADDGTIGEELWVTDGTSEGTHVVADIAGDSFTRSSDPRGLVAVGDRLFFTANDGVHGQEFWVTSGSPSTTNLVIDLAQGAASFDRPYSPLDDQSRTDYHFFSLHPPVGTYVGAGEIDGQLFFGSPARLSEDGETFEREFWRTDGTALGTTLLTTVSLGLYGHYPVYDFVGAGDAVYFSMIDQLWAFDADFTSAELISSKVNGWNVNPTTFDELLYFRASVGGSAYGRILASAGTLASTTPVSGTGLRVSTQPDTITNLNGQLIFAAESEATGEALWSGANGTLIVDPYPNSASGEISSLRSIGNQTFFFSGRSISGVWTTTLWVTDGTAQGTQQLSVLPQPPAITTNTLRSENAVVELNGKLLFATQQSAGRGPAQLWISDGTVAGTRMIHENAGCDDGNRRLDVQSEGRLWDCQIASAGNLAYFTAWDAEHGQELWQTDGTPEGTRIVKDIRPGPASSYPGSLTDVNGTLYFTADDGIHGREVWTITADALEGDLNGDGIVGLADLMLLRAQLFSGESAARGAADMDGDGSLNLADIAMLVRNFGRSSPAKASQATASVVAKVSPQSSQHDAGGALTATTSGRARSRAVARRAVDSIVSDQSVGSAEDLIASRIRVRRLRAR